MEPDPRPTIIHVVNTLCGGGTERTLVALLCSFDPSRFRHKVVTLRAAGERTVKLPDHVSVRALEAKGSSRRCGWTLATYCRRQHAALIHARNTCTWVDAATAGLLARRSRVVLGFHGLESPMSFTTKQRWSARCAYRAGATFTAVGHAAKQQLHEQASIPSESIHVLHNGIDLSRFTKNTPSNSAAGRSELSFAADDLVVGTVGSLSPVKNHAMLIKAMSTAIRSVPKLRLLIVGEGPLRQTLEKQVLDADLQSSVRFTGQRENVVDLMGCMDMYVCSSTSEATSNAMLEAMASGLPIVTTDVGDHAEHVRDNVEGFVVPSGDPKVLSDRLILLGRSGQRRRELATATRQRAQEFDFNRTIKAYEDYYADALKGS